jgi:hypothetical protein
MAFLLGYKQDWAALRCNQEFKGIKLSMDFNASEVSSSIHDVRPGYGIFDEI